jgi:NitT/TauT family transport system ATP-binding protein
MVTHDLGEAFHLGTRVIAFERPRNRPEEAERFGATLSEDLADGAKAPAVANGATVTRDIEVWPKKVPAALPEAKALS